MVLNAKEFHEPDPPTPFKFLKDGELYPVRPEQRGNGLYWYMRKMINGNNVTVYLGGIGQLETDILTNAVDHLLAQCEATQ